MPQRRIETNLVPGVAGQPYSSALTKDCLTAINDDPRAKQISTFTVASTSTEGTVTLEGLEIESDTGLADESAVAADLVDKINNEPLVNGVLVAEQSTADVVVTALVGGTGFEAEAGTNTTLAATQANAEADPVPFGRLVAEDGQSGSDGELLAKIVGSATDVTADALGVALYTASYEKSQGDDGEYPAQATMNVLRKGRVYVPTEVDVAVGDDVYVRHTADGSLDVIGGFAKASGTGKAELSDARWIRGTERGVAVLQIDLT